jgi:hypothetical protein
MTNTGDYLSTLESAIRMRHNCRPTHKQTVFVRATTEEAETVWEGLIEEFDLASHATAKICYAWRHTEPDGRSKIIAVLRNTFIDSPQKAVEAAIFTDAQPPVRNFSDDMKSLAKQLQECKELIRKMGIKSADLFASIDSTANQGTHLAEKPGRI